MDKCKHSLVSSLYGVFTILAKRFDSLYVGRTFLKMSRLWQVRARFGRENTERSERLHLCTGSAIYTSVKTFFFQSNFLIHIYMFLARIVQNRAVVHPGPRPTFFFFFFFFVLNQVYAGTSAAAPFETPCSPPPCAWL